MSLIEVPKYYDKDDTVGVSKNISDFDDHEKAWFNIDYYYVYGLREVMNLNDYNTQSINQGQQKVHNFLTNVNLYDDISSDIDNIRDEFNEDQLSFIVRINNMIDEDERTEEEVREMVRSLLQLFEFDFSHNLHIYTERRIIINIGEYHENGESEIIGYADILLIAGNLCICLICEAKRYETTRIDLMQIVGYMIGSIQENYKRRRVIFPNKMLGIIICGFQVRFCSLEISEKYLKDLYYSLPENDNRGSFNISNILDIRSEQDREILFENLVVLRRFLTE